MNHSNAIRFPSRNLHVIGCKRCGFLWNNAFTVESIHFDGEYEQDGTYSSSYRSYLDEVASKAIKSINFVEKLRILEIGCGQGQFLCHLIRMDKDNRIETIDGFDPAYRGLKGAFGNNINIHGQYFNKSSSKILSVKPNLIILRHVLGYVQDPVEFLTLLREVIDDNETTLFIESPDAAWVLNNRAIQDIFYETCSFYTPSSLAMACRLSGFDMVSSTSVFGDQYFLATARPSTVYRPPELPNLIAYREQYIAYWRGLVAESQGPVAVWGAAAKGVGFTQLVDPGSDLIEMLVDINPAKQGCFVPITGHRIVSAQEAVQAGVRTIIVANPLYRDEVDVMFRALGGSAEVIGLEGTPAAPLPRGDAQPASAA
ncbi:class I SAM-dependent methyltransferase [Labrys sp. La1]|uniref:class I SAM-dependent methyltransferase n=1 Tax=Labrys sp. La1 TaxID=3404917 RepID=UPI003EBC6C95